MCDRLIGEGNDVLCVDNLFTGREQSIVHLISNPLLEFMSHDVIFPLYMRVDEIYNLALFGRSRSLPVWSGTNDKKELEWEPAIELEEGLARTIEFFKEL